MENRKWNFDGQEVIGSKGAQIEWDGHQFFILSFNGKKYFGEILENKSEDNHLKIKINHRVFDVRKKGPLDELIAVMGLDVPKVRKLKELEAPMPGRILNISVEVGQELAIGDEILSLEAMKMENVLKAEGIGIVKEILIEENQVVEKGTILIEFE
jgi:biotin carboxyl carrier protein